MTSCDHENCHLVRAQNVKHNTDLVYTVNAKDVVNSYKAKVKSAVKNNLHNEKR